MENPGSSLFQGPDIRINNSQNNEEDEDLEDQKRRKEELQNLLTAALDDFNYDESTINSSTNVSVASCDEEQHRYKHATESNEQLKILYEIRLRELNKNREEYNNYRTEKTQEINLLKNKLLLSEAEIKQLQISQKNAENLLVEKTNKIAELNEVLNCKDLQLKNYEKTVETFQFEISSYQSTINELQLKLQTDINPFNYAAKKFNSEELQKAHQEQVARLEAVLNEQTKAVKILEKEKITLQQELQKIITEKHETEVEDKCTINALTNTLEGAQQQCKDLLDVVELLTKENHHLQGRINEMNTHNFQEAVYQLEPLDNNALLVHIEKLKKMLLDKSIHLDTLNTKLKHYEDDVKELLEFRQLKCDVYKKEFQQCDNKDHIKSLLLMQNDLQNYRRTIEDKNQQILTLNSTNRDLQEKIEEMLLQTRNDIQNLSHKYSLPQLEQMTRELKKAEEKVKELQEKLDKSEEKQVILVQKLQKYEENVEKDLTNELEFQLTNLKKNADKEKSNFENQIKKLQKDLEISSAEIKSLKQFTEDLIDENAKIKLELKNHLKSDKTESESREVYETATIKSEYEQLKKQLNQVMVHLQNNTSQKDVPEAAITLIHDMEKFLLSLEDNDIKNLFKQKVQTWKAQLAVVNLQPNKTGKTMKDSYEEAVEKLEKANKKIQILEEALDDLRNAKTIAEGEKCTFQFQVKDCESELEHAQKSIKYLENEIQNLTKTLKEKDDIISELNQNSVKSELNHLKDQLSCKESALKISEENNKELNELLQKVELQFEESKKEVLKLQKEVAEVNDKRVRRNLEKELKEVESNVEHSKIEDEDVSNTEYFKKSLQAEILKNELKLREDLQQEYLRKIKEIEAKYHKSCATTTDLYKEQIDKMKNQETRYREHLSKILAECAQKISEFERDKEDLIIQLNYLQAEYDDYKKQVYANDEYYKQLIKRVQIESENSVEEWKNWSKQFVSNCLKIETITKTSRDKILFGMNSVDSEIAVIEKSYKDKIKKYLKNEKNS